MRLQTRLAVQGWDGTHKALHSNGAVTEVRLPNEDVDYDWVAILALLLGITKHLDHLIPILP